VGVIEEIPDERIVKIAKPVGLSDYPQRTFSAVMSAIFTAIYAARILPSAENGAIFYAIDAANWA